VTPPPAPPVPALEGAGAGQTLPLYEELEESALERLLSRGKVRSTLFMLGPAFVASIAYVDPGNFATNVQGGAQFGYLLLWVVLAANLVAMVIQYLSAKLGIVTDHNYPELVREHFPRWFASESMTQIRVLISPHLRGLRLYQEGVFDDRARTFSRQQRGPSTQAVSVAFAEV
jgi:hypothetical protein